MEAEGTYVFLEALSEHRDDIVPLGIGRAEALGPPDQLAMVDLILPCVIVRTSDC